MGVLPRGRGRSQLLFSAALYIWGLLLVENILPVKMLGGLRPPRTRLGTEHRSQNKNVFQTSAEQKQNSPAEFPNRTNGPKRTTEQKPTSERLKTDSPRTPNKTSAEQKKRHRSPPCLHSGLKAFSSFLERGSPRGAHV